MWRLSVRSCMYVYIYIDVMIKNVENCSFAQQQPSPSNLFYFMETGNCLKIIPISSY